MSDTLDGGIALATALALSDLTFERFWLDYCAIGGNHTSAQLLVYLAGHTCWPPTEHNMAAQVLDERCAELNLGRPTLHADAITGSR
jgi:hypothetical protein